MSTQPKIYVTGHRGMVGSTILRTLQQQGQADIVTLTNSSPPMEDGEQQLAWVSCCQQKEQFHD